jgi:hypothetical protein
MVYPGRCSSLRLVLMPLPLGRVALVPVLLVPAALVLTVPGAIRAWGARARVVLWFGRMR